MVLSCLLKGMSLDDIKSEFASRVQISLEGIMQGAVRRNAKFKKYFTFKPATTTERLMTEMWENLDNFNK